ncbi:hypothetical protein [Winogradskyella bathintestinalis]|jgi:uncharacterized coiled-coil protein SlyX|uniref:Uncharacterized protein n=1 Tax=Winogradskyella bathintestinalis TaxID=3035208 RepID=A0ABT7ZVF0_9FLAO|nr:hypothetical protein [Winogradskyella bathintestinalis]MDN3492789.1 hypothetical protein [Winogradskyella bathintestinalis]
MDLIKILAIVLGATGFWKLIEMLLQYGMQKRLKSAEIRNLNVQANSLVVENYKLWSENMEKRLKQLESKNTLMNKTITKQRDRITDLERYIEQLEAEIQLYNKQKNNERG